MRRTLGMLGIAASALTGCLGGPPVYPRRAPVMGSIFTSVQSHDNATENPVSTRVSRNCATGIWIPPIFAINPSFAWGDASASKDLAPEDTVSVVDTDMVGILGVYAQHCSVVHVAAAPAQPATPAPSAPATPSAAPPGTPGTPQPSSPPPPSNGAAQPPPGKTI